MPSSLINYWKFEPRSEITTTTFKPIELSLSSNSKSFFLTFSLSQLPLTRWYARGCFQFSSIPHAMKNQCRVCHEIAFSVSIILKANDFIICRECSSTCISTKFAILAGKEVANDLHCCLLVYIIMFVLLHIPAMMNSCQQLSLSTYYLPLFSFSWGIIRYQFVV